MAGERDLVPGGNQDGVQTEGGFQSGGGGASTSSTSTTLENFAVPAPGRGVGESMAVATSDSSSAATGNGRAGGPVSGNGGAGSSRNLHQSAIPQSSSASFGSSNANAMRQYLSKEQRPTSQSSKGSTDAGAVKTYKQMLESVKKLEASGDKLQERISNIYCEFGNAILNGSFMFDPSVIEIMQSEPPVPGCELRDPTSAHFTRKAVDGEYQSLVRRLEARPPIEED